MKKTLGILGLLIVVFLATAYMAESFLTPFNLENLIRRTSLFGIISIGVAFVIITGGIDLSIGSVVCLIGCGLPFLLHVDYQPNHQATLTDINAAKASITLKTTANFPKGSYIRLFDSNATNSGIYTVKNSQGTSITIDPAPANDDDRGSIVQVFPIEQSNKKNKSITTPAGLNSRDQVTFIKANGDVGLTTRVLNGKGNNYSLHEAAPDKAKYILALHRHQRTSVPVALTLVFLFSLGIGLSHGFMVAKIKLQPFVVTLCGLLLYRGITRGFTEDQTQGFQAEYPDLRLIATAKLGEVDYAQALILFGGIIITAGIGWLLWQSKKNAPINERRWPIIPIVLGAGIALCGFYQAKHVPVIEEGFSEEQSLTVIKVPTDGNQTLTIDLPAGTRKFVLEGQEASNKWIPLTQKEIKSSTSSYETKVPPLKIIRERTEKDWLAARIRVLAREDHVVLPLGARTVLVEARDSKGQWIPLGEPKAIAPHDKPVRHPVASLATLRTQQMGDLKALRLKVTHRELPRIGIPAPCLILIVVAVAAGIFLNHTIYGRYLLALGRNEEAAKYSGINTDRMIILAYVICSLLAGLGGMLFVMDVNSAQPVDFGNFYELYAIAAAVLGGCSLRGGEGTILGVIIGACLMRVLKNMITLVDEIPTHIEYAIIGAVILAGVIVDELIKRYAAKRAARQQDSV